MRRFQSLHRQADFARLRRQGRRVATKSLLFYHGDPLRGDRLPLVGITVSKAIGKAVVRNKVRRRLAAAIHEALARRGTFRLLVVARPQAAAAPYRDLRDEVTAALGGSSSWPGTEGSMAMPGRRLAKGKEPRATIAVARCER